MAYRPPPKRRWNYVTAEAALVLTVLFLAFAAGIAGFAVGRATAEDDEPAAAETGTQEATTSEATTPAETETAAETTETGGGEVAQGMAVFEAAGCGACHTFTPAGSSGTVGPNLDNTKLNRGQIEQQVQNGGGGMPAFKDRLTNDEIRAVADFVENG